MQTSQKVAFNTLVMYTKVLVTIGVSLYSTRLILCELGAEDFGIFNLIAGVVGMLAFLNTSVSLASQRYLSYTIGEKNRSHYDDVFHASTRIGLWLALLLFVVIQLFGFFFLDKLNYAEERSFAVQVVFQCVAISTFFSVMSIPYESAIMANEDIYVISCIYIVESFLKFLIAIYLIYTPYDKLIVYGVLLVSVYISTNIYKMFFTRKYKSGTHVGGIKTNVIREMIKFSGWTSLEPLSTLFSVQGIAVMLNLFGGTVVNAAYGIANQVSGQMNYFSNSLLGAFSPQIMKSEGMNDRERTVRLSMFACKLSFFLLIFFSVPLLLEMPFVLRIWLVAVPENTVLFCRLILLSIITLQLSSGLQCGITAVGDIKWYQLTIGLTKVLALLVTFVLLKMGLPIYVAVVSFLCVEVINFVVRIGFAQKVMNMNLTPFLFNAMRMISAFCVTLVALYFVRGIFYDGFHRLALMTLMSSALLMVMLRYLILDANEWNKIRNTLRSLILRKIQK